LFKKINLSKLQFANTFSLPKKEEKNDKRLKKRNKSNQRLNSENGSKPLPRGRGYINSSTNYEDNITEERNFSHEVTKNEKWLKNKIAGKLNLGKNLVQ
jgi:hypothetical protein